MLKKLSKYMKGLWGLAAISAAGMIVEAICELALPSLPEQKVWYLTADTNTPEVFLTEENQKKVSAKTVIVPPRSIIILTGKQEKRQNDESMAAL